MKFGKRLAVEASRRWANYYFDYKAIKNAIKDDVQSKDTNGTNFQKLLVSELQKVSQFYADKAAQLEATLHHLTSDATQLRELRTEVQELIKFVALNYLAVVKAIKKRNRHLRENFGSSASTSLHALDLLMGEVFFTSPRLASLATQAEVLAQKHASQKSQQQAEAASQMLEEYQCPVCLETLHNPVVLTCAHRFCWGCLVAHCTATRDSGLPAGQDKSAGPTTYRVLEQIACCDESESPKFYSCPVCRKPQILDVESLQVDTYLSNFIEGLKTLSAVSLHPPAVVSPPPAPSWGIIPPQAPQHQGKLTILLDLDGTLASSFTPKRAPRLPSYIRTHIVGVGSKLNPQGVFVVERPGLREFLEELAGFAEVIVFTAGLEDYAKPIVDAIDPEGKLFAGRIYREGTLRTDYYQCVKDMARLNRDLQRTVLVDDTPLAFLHQPENGIPVLGFRGDPDDRLLLEAVLPLLQVLADESDVRPVLQRRFDMSNWFKRHGFPVEGIVQAAAQNAEEERQMHVRHGQLRNKELAAHQHHHQQCRHEQAKEAVAAAQAPVTAAACSHSHAPVQQPESRATASKDFLLLMDFDKTITDYDAGERVMEQLAPELLPMLVGMESPTNFIPITNTLLSELARRGVSRDHLLSTLHQLGRELPAASMETLDLARRRQVDTKILSDCNSVFISHILAGAGVSGMVQEVITNAAGFERGVADEASQGSQVGLGVGLRRSGSGGCHKLVIRPRHGDGKAPHGCHLCPSNLCKGAEVQAVTQRGIYRSIIFAGDGANDICPALALGPQDFVLAREGYALAQYLQQAAADGKVEVRATVRIWGSHRELKQHVQEITAQPSAMQV